MYLLQFKYLKISQLENNKSQILGTCIRSKHSSSRSWGWQQIKSFGRVMNSRRLYIVGFSSRFSVWNVNLSFASICITHDTWGNKGCVTLWPLPFTLKSILRQKKNYGNSNISPCKNIIFKKSSTRNQNPWRYYNSETNLKFQHKPKYIIFFKNPHNKNRPIT